MDAMSRNVSDFVEFFKLSGRSSEGRLERVKGIEPSYSAWEAAALPLSYTRKPAENRGSRSRLGRRLAVRLPDSCADARRLP